MTNGDFLNIPTETWIGVGLVLGIATIISLIARQFFMARYRKKHGYAIPRQERQKASHFSWLALIVSFIVIFLPFRETWDKAGLWVGDKAGVFEEKSIDFFKAHDNTGTYDDIHKPEEGD